LCDEEIDGVLEQHIGKRFVDGAELLEQVVHDPLCRLFAVW
jgi:hypothetical protein